MQEVGEMEKIVKEIRSMRRAVYIAIILYILFWATVIALIHLVMIPAIK